jgi:nucleotide-binding universal stress UspA family protein
MAAFIMNLYNKTYRPSYFFMEKILVPTDLTPIAELGLQLAVEIAKRSGAIISLVNFTKHPFGKTFTATGDVTLKTDPEEERFMLDLIRVNQGKLEELAAKYRTGEVEIEYGIIDDELKNGVDDYLDKELIDLVVMGTSGEERAEEAFVGNHTEQVIKISSCPVLSVRDGFNVEDLDRIVLAVNRIKEDYALVSLNTLRQLAECFNAHIFMVHVRDKSASDEGLENYFEQMAHTAALEDYSIHIVDADDQAEGVISFARENNAGLIAVIKNSRDGIFRIFSNHFSNRLVKEVGRPVFTFNLQNVS